MKPRDLIEDLTPFQWLEVVAIFVLTVVCICIDHSQSWWYISIDTIATLTGVICVVLCAAGNKQSYYWGFVNIFTYIVIAWINGYYGEVMLNGLYYLPMQFIGLYNWSKHYNTKANQVESKKMSYKQVALFLATSAVCVVAYKFLLDWIKGTSTLLDSMSTVLSLFACFLMTQRYREQWLLWIIIDVITVGMWIIVKDGLMIAMWSIYLINALYGWIVWSKAIKPRKVEYCRDWLDIPYVEE